MAATVKAGGPCSKLRQTQIVGKIKYTCIKSGKKLVWDSGVRITPPVPTSSISPTPSPNATKNHTYTIGWICDAVVDAAGAKDLNGTEIVCVQGSDGKYSWMSRADWEKSKIIPTPTPRPTFTPTLAPTQTPTPSSSPTTTEIILNFRCNPNTDSTGKTKSGISVTCKANSAGQYMWTEDTPPVQNNFSYPLPPIGESCSKDGLLAWNGALAICKGGKVRYATNADIPTSATGFTSRPDWYPTLAEINIPGPQKDLGCNSSSIVFTSSVVPLDEIGPTIPYGMVVGDHVTPIDHAYITLKVANKPESTRTEADYVPVSSPADGTIILIGGLGASTTSHRVVIDHGCGVYTVYMVLNRFAGVLSKYQSQVDNGQTINPKLPIKSGEIFGLQRDNPIDFNVWDGSAWLSGFANPAAYITGDTWKPYTVDYLPFFTPEIRAVMEQNLQRTSTPRVGKIDYDNMGGAAGNWFLKDYFGYGCTPISQYENASGIVNPTTDSNKNYYSWCHLSIAPHNVDPTAWILSIGWWKNPAGDSTQAFIVIAPNQVTPDKLTTSSGTVIYRLTQVGIEEPAGTPTKNAAAAPLAIGYKVKEGNTIGYLTIRVTIDGSLNIEITTPPLVPSNFSRYYRTYTR